MTCPSCGGATPAGARFCPSCGQPLEVRVDERRVVTVLFADLVGFTTLSEARDPEQVKNLVDTCFQWLAAGITDFGGKVDKIVGDAIVALFGAPVAHEDDAERAVRAALHMQRTIEERTNELGATVELRVGVNTGEVLVGALRAGGDYTAMGDVVNVASRLQTTAKPGQIVVGPRTHELTAEVVDYEGVGTIPVRGREEPVEAWVARGTLALPGQRPRRVAAPLVGRDQELAMLGHAVSAAVGRQRAQLVLILGEAGIGKSRLTEEMAKLAVDEHQATVLEGRCIPYGEANVWWPVAEALRQACGIELSDAAEVSLAKTRAAVAAAGRVDASDPSFEHIVAGLQYLMGDEDALRDVEPSRARDEALRSVEALLEGVARRRPLVIILSELHWADALVLDLVDDALERLRQLPVVVVATARPELEERWSPRPGRHNLLLLNLDPLDRSAAAQLLTWLLGDVPSPDLRDLLLERSGGNPFFLEELATLWRDASLVVPALSGGALPAGGSATALPATLRGLLAARIDALPPAERATLEDAAVLGRRGPVAAVEALAESRGHHDASLALASLAERDLVALQDGQCVVKSELVREVAYETLTKAERARRHAALGVWLEHQGRETKRAAEYLEQVAHHYGTAAELVMELGPVDGVPGDIMNRTHHAIESAAKRAELREHHLATVRLYDQAIRLLVKPSATKRKVLLGRAAARASLRQHDGARADLAEALADARERDDQCSVARALAVRGHVEQNEGRFAESLASLDEAIAVARAADDEATLGLALRLRGMTSLFSGDTASAEIAIRESLDAARRVGSRRDEGWALRNLAWVAMQMGDFDAADRRLHTAAEAFTEIGDDGGRDWALGMLAYVRYFQGRRAEAEELAVRLLPTQRTAGDRWATGMLQMLLASVRLWDGRTSEALAPAEEACATLHGLGDVQASMRAATTKARVLAALGRLDEARAVVDEMMASLDEAVPLVGMEMLTAGAVIDLDVGDVDGARRRLGPFDVDVVSDPVGQYSINVIVAMAQLQAGEMEAAERHLAAAHGALSGGNKTNVAAHLALARLGLDDLAGALEVAADATADEETTYRDRALAHVAVALARARASDGPATSAAVAAARAQVDGTTDRLWQAVVHLGCALALEGVDDSGASAARNDAERRLADLGIHGEGWRTVFAAAVGD